MLRRPGRLSSSLPLIAVVSALPLSAARSETTDELYAKAKMEGALVIYTGAGAAGAKALADAFEKQFPGITVEAHGGFSNVLDHEIDQQIRDKKVTADFVNLQTVQDLRRWDKARALMHFKAEGFDQVLPPLKDKDGAWVAANATPIVYGYNSDKVQEADVPKSPLDFLQPQFRGKVVTVYPTDDDATLYNFDLIVQKYGWDFMKKYMANDPYFIQGHRDVAARVRSGEDFVSFDISNTNRGGGGSLKVALPQADKIPVFFTGTAILKDAPHPNSAKLMVTWLLSKEQQGRNPLAYSSRADMPPPAGMPPLTDSRFANGYRDFLGDGSRLPALRKRYEAFIGPVVNKATQ